jgi:hypothetical protein
MKKAVFLQRAFTNKEVPVRTYKPMREYCLQQINEREVTCLQFNLFNQRTRELYDAYECKYSSELEKAFLRSSSDYNSVIITKKWVDSL